MNLVDMVGNLLDPNNHIMYDLEVDDRDFKEFPNFYQFCIKEEGINQPLWARQFFLALTLLNEICPTCSTKFKHVLDLPKDYDSYELQKHFTLMEYGRCPRCKKSKLDHYRSGAMYAYSELAGLAGQRIGKSLMACAISAYLTHKMLKLQNPEKIYGTLQTTFMGTFVGLTYAKAVEMLWLPYSGIIDGSPWFMNYHKMLHSLEKERGATYLKYGQSLHYLHRGIYVYPSGPNRKTLRGNTRFLGVTDEMDFFNTEDSGGGDQVKLNGVEVYKSLVNSALTVRVGWRDAIKSGQVNVPNAYQLNISSPQHMRGVLTQIVMNNKNSKRIFCFHLPTWEVHPKISEKDIQREYADDPEKASRDFGAIPPSAENPFIDQDSALLLFSNKPNWVRIEYIHGKVKNGSVRRAGKIVHQLKPSNLPPSVMSMDAGYSGNSFGLTIGHFVKTTSGRLVKFPVVIEIAPEKGKYTLSYSKIYENIMLPLIEAYNVQAVLADRWNSIKILHDLESKFNLYTEIKSIKYNELINVRSYIEDNMIELPARETDISLGDLLVVDTTTYPSMFKGRPVDHLLMQLCTVSDTGRSVEKGSRLTDDIWRAMALGASVLIDEEWCAKNLHETKKGGNRGLIAICGNTGVYGVDGRTGSLASNNNPVNVGSVGSVAGARSSTSSLYNAFRR
jgi:hypothetical protein